MMFQPEGVRTDGPHHERLARVVARPRLPEPGARRGQLELLTQQLDGIEAWQAACRARLARLAAAAPSRKGRLDRVRERQVLLRERDALVAKTHAQLLREDGSRFPLGPRALLVPRNPWVFRAIAQALAEEGVEVVGEFGNGADGVGFGIAEQPELALVDETLPMVSGAELVRELRRFAPQTVVAVHVQDTGRIGPLLDAGARCVFTRLNATRDVARDLLQLLRTERR